ncbi:MAG: HAD family hydrolase [Cytophagaceae bacterium]
MELSGIKNLIFDLGGIIINIDFQRTFEAFARAAGKDVLGVVRKFEDERIFARFEKGDLNEAEVRFLINKELNTALSDEETDKAWNALLMDIPPPRIEMLRELAKNHRIFLLSNTNSIHIREVNNILHKSNGIPSLNQLFERVYYSYEIHMSKPSTEIYEFVLMQNGLKATETLFIDDNIDNIRGAAATGLQTLHINYPEESVTDHLVWKKKIK